MKASLPRPTPAEQAAPTNPELEALVWLAGLKPYLKQIVVGALALLVAGVAVAAWLNSRRSGEAKGYAELAKANSDAALAELAAKFPGHEIGREALFRQATLLFAAGKYDDAVQRFQMFLDKYPADGRAAQAGLGLAYALEAGRKVAEAETRFSTLAQQPGAPEFCAEAYVGAGRAAELQGHPGDAERWYKAAVATGADGYYKSQALEGIKRLTAASAGAAPVTEEPKTAGGAPAAPAE